MEVHGTSEPGKLEQIVSQFLLKCLHIILDSRIPSIRPHDHSGELSSGSRVRRSDKWFNMVLGDRPAALDNLNFWHRNIMDPMVIDIILVHQGPNSSSVDNLYAAPAVGTTVETVIERWVVQYDTPRVMTPQVAESSVYYKKTYKKLIILLRSLYMQMRLLPAHRVFRQLSSSSQTYNFDIIYKVSSFTDPFSREEEEKMKEYVFAPVDAYPGRLCISVTYRPTVSDCNLEPSTSMPAKIISDYVGSPTTDPLRSFPSIEKASFPLRGVGPHSSPFQRPHSWTSGFHRGASLVQNQPLYGSPPVHRTFNNPYDFPSPPNDFYSNRVQNYRPLANQKQINYDEYQLSPPFSSSASPSPPTYLYSGNPLRTRMHPESAPVTIPYAVVGRSPRYHVTNLSDSSKSSLPPPSPRSTKHDPSSQGSSSGSRSLRKQESLRVGEVHIETTHRSISQKVNRDNRDDSGRFSGLLSSSGSPRTGFSRSSSRLSFQDDQEDGDFSCPFDVDDVDPPIFRLSRNSDGEKASDFSSQSLPMPRQSPDAAVGVLVHMLRTAPPLRQDSSCCSSQSMKNEVEGGISTASGFFMGRKTSDALEELRSYRDMKNLLLSKSKTSVHYKEATNTSVHYKEATNSRSPP